MATSEPALVSLTWYDGSTMDLCAYSVSVSVARTDVWKSGVTRVRIELQMPYDPALFDASEWPSLARVDWRDRVLEARVQDVRVAHFVSGWRAETQVTIEARVPSVAAPAAISRTVIGRDNPQAILDALAHNPATPASDPPPGRVKRRYAFD